MTTIQEALFAFCSLSMLIVYSSGSSADGSFRDELLARIQALEDQGRGQADKIQHMEVQLVDQHERLVRQETTIHEYKQRVAVLERTVTELHQEYKQRVAVLERTVAELQHEYKQRVAVLERTVKELQHEYKQRVVVLERTVAELQHKHDPDLSEDSDEPQDSDLSQNSGETQDDMVGREPGLRIQQRSINTPGSKEAVKHRRVLVGEGPVAFHAVITQFSEIDHIGKGQHIMFPDVMLNLGGGYHSLHGVFIAPQPGVYLFSTSIMSYKAAHPEISVHLMKNGQVLANAYGHGDAGRHDQGSVTVVTQLVAGDEVWISLDDPDDTSLWGNLFDSFTGCLITPL